MDKIACSVLDKFFSLSTNGKYVVVSADELFENFPSDAEFSERELKAAVDALVAEGYLDLKYRGGEMYCAAPLKKYTPPVEDCTLAEQAQPEAETAERKEKKPKTTLAVFFAAFAGGAAGSMLIVLLSALIA